MVGFGPHLTLDGYGCSREKLENLELIYSILEDFPSSIGMTKIMPPYVFKYNGVKPEDWGISGFVLIAESHISLHTFPCKNYLSFDIFSCKIFDIDKAVEYITSTFDVKKFEKNVFERGLEFPKDIGLSTKIVNEQRRRIVPLDAFKGEIARDKKG